MHGTQRIFFMHGTKNGLFSAFLGGLHDGFTPSPTPVNAKREARKKTRKRTHSDVKYYLCNA